MKSQKAKGKLLENYIAQEIIKRGLDDRAIRDGASGAGSSEKRDINTSLSINGRLAGIEAKNQKKIALLKWWKQALQLEQLDYEPLLVFKPPQESLDETLVTLRLSTFLDILQSSDTSESVNKGVQQTDKWQLQRTREELRKAIKILSQFLD